MRDETSLIIPAVRAVLDEALAAGRRTTDAGKAIDEHQVHAERLAYAATEAAAAEALAAYARERAGDETAGRMAAAFAGEVASRLGAEIEGQCDDFGVTGETLARTLGAPEVLAAVRAAQHEARLREIGREIIRTRGANNSWIDGDLAEMARDSARGFARKEVAPIAERIHRHDELVPESIIRRMTELGYFGMSVPEEYGGQGMGNLVMIVITEELSAASLAAAGSLITRPEILTKALLKGGTEAQKRRWLPPIAAGELMVGISVTEPDTGSDVASVRCRAERTEGAWLISGAKAWCTFAGRADVRATGLAQAALEATATYAGERKQFGRPIGDFQLTQYKLGRMATHLAAARQLTYAAARAMDRDETVVLEPAMAKLFASDVAVRVTQEGQLLHGGWGYAEEFAISRHVVDALVLPIFEGVKPILELKVIARGLLGG